MTSDIEEAQGSASCGGIGLLTDEFWSHRRAARRERLLGWRSVLDAAIRRLEEPQQQPRRRGLPHLMPDAFWAHCKAARREDLLAARSIVEGLLARLGSAKPVEKATRVEVE